MSKNKLQLILYCSVGIICGSLAGFMPLYRLLILAVGLGVLAGIINTLVIRLTEKVKS